MNYFKEEISSLGKPYYRNKITNETQWGFKTYHNTNKPLPKGWVRLNLDGKPFYKYISNKKELTNYYSSYAYSPTELEEISPNQRAATLEYTTETTVPLSSIKSVKEIHTLRDVLRHQIAGLRYNEKKPDILMPPSREPALNFKVNPIEQEKVERKLIEDAKKIEEERNVMLHKRIVRKRIAEENKRIADLDAQKINLLQEQIKLLQEQLKVAQEEITENKKVREQERVFTSAKIDHEASLNLAGYHNFMKQYTHPQIDKSRLRPRDMDLWMIKLTQKDREEWIQQISPQNKNDCKKLSECDNIWQDIRKQNKIEERSFAADVVGKNQIDILRMGRTIFFTVPPAIDLPTYPDKLSLRNFESLRTGKSIFDSRRGHYRDHLYGYYTDKEFANDWRRAETGVY